MIKNEIWKNIQGYEGYYQISNYGKVKSLKFNKEKILKPGLTSNGYLQITLFKNNKRKKFMIHRLVGEYFIPNPKNKPEIDHEFGDKIDNYYRHLKWVTSSENSKNAYKIKLRKPTHGEINGQSKLTKKQVLEIRNMYQKNKITYEKIAKLYNISFQHVGDIINKRRWRHI